MVCYIVNKLPGQISTCPRQKVDIPFQIKLSLTGQVDSARDGYTITIFMAGQTVYVIDLMRSMLV